MERSLNSAWQRTRRAGRRRVWRAVFVALVVGYFLYLFGGAELHLYMLNQRMAAVERSLSAVQDQNRSLVGKLHSLAETKAAAKRAGPGPSGETLYQVVKPSGG